MVAIIRNMRTVTAVLYSVFVSFFGGGGDVAFSEYFCTVTAFLFVWKVRRTFFPPGCCFSTVPCDHGLDFLHQLM